MTTRPVRVLLVWPGSDGDAAGEFGMPQLVIMATWAHQYTGAHIELRDLFAEQALRPTTFDEILDGDAGDGYDIIGFSVYSSFDHLKCWALAEMARERYPDALIVAGGYHPSARPEPYLDERSPYDVCVVGEGERPLVQLIESMAGGDPIRNRILGPLPLASLDLLPPSDWSYLERYRPIARKIATQAQIYLSRGCPFECVFCMERAKREVSWRALPVERAVEEIVSLHRFLNLEGWTLFVADALFGMRRDWRREFLEALARQDLPIDQIWLLIRLDLLEEEDLVLLKAAGCSPGFGLESGDPEHLARIRKTGRLDDYLGRMEMIADRARTLDLAWGANIIAGHPGETRETMQRTADFLRSLFLERGGTTGFLSVDPFRLYPGSPIDAERDRWERETGARFHRPSWWEDGDQAFLSEWVDPSHDLSYLERESLHHELFAPLLGAIEDQFVYSGPARDYFLRAIRSETEHGQPGSRIDVLDRYYAWRGYLGDGAAASAQLADHDELARLAQHQRRAVLPEVAEDGQVALDHPVIRALERVPRERFVPLDQICESTEDVAIAVDSTGWSTVSAMHAYARSFSLLGITPGDAVLDLGSGTGYGSALLGELVGATGSVRGVEVDPALVAWAAEHCAPNVHFRHGDAANPADWGVDPKTVTRVHVGFAMSALPAEWAEALPEGAVVVAPLGTSDTQVLTRARVRDGRFDLETFEAVQYVSVRTSGSTPPRAQSPDQHLAD